MTAHLHWRFYITQGTGSYVGIYQLDFQDADGASLASLGTASASSTYGSYSASKPFPPTNTYWIANNTSTAWIRLSFASAVTVDRVVVAGYGPCSDSPAQPSVMELQYSDDGITWTRDFVVTRPLAGWTFGAAITCVRPIASETSQYWAFLMETAQNSGGNFLVAELRFLDVSGVAFAGYSNEGGSITAGGQPWSLAWDNDITTSARAGGAFDAVIAYAKYPTDVLVAGLSYICDQDNFYADYTPQTGSIWNSLDGNTWGKVFDASPSNATGAPFTHGGQTVLWNYTPSPPAPLPPIPNLVTSQAMLGSF